MTNQRFQECIEVLAASIIECNHCTKSCLDEPDINKMIHCMQLSSDCAAMCQLTMDILIAGNEYINDVCDLCASFSENCADECEKFPELDYCVNCAAICRQCAEHCISVMHEAAAA